MMPCSFPKAMAEPVSVRAPIQSPSKAVTCSSHMVLTVGGCGVAGMVSGYSGETRSLVSRYSGQITSMISWQMHARDKGDPRACLRTLRSHPSHKRGHLLIHMCVCYIKKVEP